MKQWAVLVAGCLVGFTQTTPAETWTLAQALEHVMAENPDARIAGHRIQSAYSRIQQAEATWWPKLEFQSGYLYSDNPVQVFGSILNQRSYSTSLDFNDVPATDNLNLRGVVTVPVYSGGRNSANREGAQAGFAASQMDARSVRLALAFAVTRAYFTLNQADAFVRVAEANVRSFESNLDVAESRLEAGTLLKPEVLDLQVRLAESEEELLQARNAKELAGRALGVVLGFEDKVIENATDVVEIHVPEQETVEGRPELASARYREQLAQAELKAARSGYRPSVNGFGAVEYNYGWRNNAGGANYTVGLLLNWNLWDGKLTRGKVGEAGARLNEVEEQRRKLRLDLAFELHQSRLALEEANERIEVAERTVALAEESVTLTRARFEEGLVLASQLIDAETAATRAQIRLISSRADQQIARAAMRRAVGWFPLTEDGEQTSEEPNE
jgi:outer membrane protein TolC